MAKSDVSILRIIYEKEGKEFVARLPTSEEKKRLRRKLKSAGRTSFCNCGEEFCDGEWVWRCMYAGGGVCDWFITYEVC